MKLVSLGILFYIPNFISFSIWQVWQCPSASASTHKRSQFELLAELEHDSGVSGEANRPTVQNATFFFFSVKKK